MTKMRLLKVLRSKVGKASTDRTGHLGTVDLILTNPYSAKRRRRKWITYRLVHTAPT